MVTKKKFIEEVEVLLYDVRTKLECEELWNSAIISYMDDGYLKENALRWKNPFINRYSI